MTIDQTQYSLTNKELAGGTMETVSHKHVTAKIFKIMSLMLGENMLVNSVFLKVFLVERIDFQACKYH